MIVLQLGLEPVLRKKLPLVTLLLFSYKNINRIGIQSFKIDQLGDFEKIYFEKIAISKPETAKIVLKLTLEAQTAPNATRK